MALIGGLSILVVGAAVVGVRTATFAPANVADGRDVKLAAAPAYDLDAAVRHLSEAAQIRTISNQDPAGFMHGWRPPILPFMARCGARSCRTGRSSIIGRAAMLRSRRLS
jgi:carboxypeptidase PM20D1